MAAITPFRILNRCFSPSWEVNRVGSEWSDLFYAFVKLWMDQMRASEWDANFCCVGDRCELLFGWKLSPRWSERSLWDRCELWGEVYLRDDRRYVLQPTGKCLFPSISFFLVLRSDSLLETRINIGVWLRIPSNRESMSPFSLIQAIVDAPKMNDLCNTRNKC